MEEVKTYFKYPRVAWSNEDIEILKTYYQEKTTVEISDLLSTKRTNKAIRNMAIKLELRKIVCVQNYDEIKYKTIEGTIYKLCKSCEEYLPLEFLYFPKDNSCNDGYRNVCKKCKGENYAISDSKIWTEIEEQILIDKYEDNTNMELIDMHFNDLSLEQLQTKGNSLGLNKTPNTLSRAAKNAMTKDVRLKISNVRKINGLSKGKNNSMYGSHRFGSLNPNYKGGISSLYDYLRRNIKLWKTNSIKECEYSCIFTGERFNDIHHLYPFNKIVDETMVELKLPVYENILDYTQDELQNIQDKCLEIHYRYPLGLCMKSKFHVLFHSNYSWSDFTAEDFYEFVERVKLGEFDKFLNDNDLKLVI